MDSVNSGFQALEDAIEHLYYTFRYYTLSQTIHACPHCVTDTEHAKLHAKPLRELTDIDLAKYSFKALTTWGGERDFCYFLPRLLELEVFPSQKYVALSALSQPEILFGKLALTQWHTWSVEEQQAIHDYFEALWSFLLLSNTLTPFSFDEYFCGIGLAVQTTTPFLHKWQTLLTSTALERLEWFLEENKYSITQKGRLENVFWNDARKQMQEVIDWVLNPHTVATFEEAFEAQIDTPIADTLAIIIDKFHALQIFTQ